METYLQERAKREKQSKVTGAVITVLSHVLVLLGVSFSGIKYLYPPPEESVFVMDFSDEYPQQLFGEAPMAPEADPEQDITLAQKSQSPVADDIPNVSQQAAPDNFGDVETPAPPVIDQRALFPGMAKQDTSAAAPHAAHEAGDSFKAGQALGNTVDGDTERMPNAHLAGRAVKGALIKPGYDSQERGKVVIDIWVNKAGKVVFTNYSDESTVTDRKLWEAAKKAAESTRFTENPDMAPDENQQGRITYYFNLK